MDPDEIEEKMREKLGKNFRFLGITGKSVTEIKNSDYFIEDLGIDSVGIMVKIKDDSQGKVNIDGSIEKKATKNDQKKLNEGASISKEILIQAGCNPESIFTTNLESAHPGGTAAIGKVVNTDQGTEIKGLFVSDASVIPESPGAPPILLIIALSKRLVKKL